MSVEEFKHLKKGDRIETELRSDKDRKIRMTGTVISKLKRKDNGKEFLYLKWTATSSSEVMPLSQQTKSSENFDSNGTIVSN